MGIPTGARSGNDSLTENQRLALQAKVLEIDGGVTRQKIRAQGDGSRIIQQYTPKDKDRKALNLSADQGLSLGDYEDFKTVVKQAAGTPLTPRQAALISIFGNSNKHGEGRNVFVEDPILQQKLNAIVQGTGRNGTAAKRKVITAGVTRTSKAIQAALGAYAGQGESLTLGTRPSGPAVPPRAEARLVAEVSGQPSLGLGLQVSMTTAVQTPAPAPTPTTVPRPSVVPSPATAARPAPRPTSPPPPIPMVRPGVVRPPTLLPSRFRPAVPLDKKELQDLLKVVEAFRRFRYAAEGRPQLGEKGVLDDLEEKLRRSLNKLESKNLEVIGFSIEKLEKALAIFQKFEQAEIPSSLAAEHELAAGLASKILMNPKFKDFIPVARPVATFILKPVDRPVAPVLAVSSKAPAPGSRDIPSDDPAASASDYATPPEVLSGQGDVPPSPPASQAPTEAELRALAKDLAQKIVSEKLKSKARQFYVAAWNYYVDKNLGAAETDFQKALKNDTWLKEVLKIGNNNRPINTDEFNAFKLNLSVVKGAPKVQDHSKTGSAEKAKE